MSKLIDQLRKTEERRREQQRSDTPRASPFRDIEAAIDELRNRIETERGSEAALRALRSKRWPLAVAAVLVTVATGAGLYALMRAPQPETPVVATGGPLMLRIDSNINAIPAKD